MVLYVILFVDILFRDLNACTPTPDEGNLLERPHVCGVRFASV